MASATTAGTAAAAARPILRIASRRARILLLKHRNGGVLPPPQARAPLKKDDTSWPKSLRYAFYAACVVSVPASVGQCISMSPRLRDWMVGDDAEPLPVDNGRESNNSGDDSGVALLSSRGIISLVRKYWGVEDYVPPVDRPRLEHVAPGYKNEWEEDNRSSLLHLVGMYAPSDDTNRTTTTTKTNENTIPMSLANEPSSDVRRDQTILDRYLSTKTNPSGVKTRLSLFSAEDSTPAMMEGTDADAGYETECTLPGNVSASALRRRLVGSQAQAAKRDLAEPASDPEFRSVSNEETIRTKLWNEECRWTVSFAATDDDAGERDDGAGMMMSGDVPLSSFGGGERPSTESTIEAWRELRRDTAVNSSWSQFPDVAAPVGSAASARGTVAGASPPSSSDSAASASNESLLVQKLKYQIETLERELRDPSSMRDRDGMYEELRLAKRELRGLKPWYRRFLG